MKRAIHGLMMLGIIAVLSSVSVGAAAGARAATSAASSHEAPQATCVGWCWFCDILENKYQVIPSQILANDEDSEVACGHHTACQSECRVTLRHDLDRITRVVASSDDKELRKLLREVTGLTLNEERRALQLQGCTLGEVILHVLLSERQVAVVGGRAATRAAVH